jgi:hypothetical protein
VHMKRCRTGGQTPVSGNSFGGLKKLCTHENRKHVDICCLRIVLAGLGPTQYGITPDLYKIIISNISEYKLWAQPTFLV